MTSRFGALALLLGISAFSRQIEVPQGTDLPPVAEKASSQPQSATDWFRRADDLFNIRLPGSPPFHMRVTFRAYPAIDFDSQGRSLTGTVPPAAPVPGHPFVVSGNGTYDEIWLSPEKWRREVTFGGYHATEVRANGVRKFQASSDYEPVRVLMLMTAMLDQVPRYLLEPELDDHHWKWNVEHLTAGAMPYVRVSLTQVFGPERLTSNLDSFDFLPAGILVRSENFGLITTWQHDSEFAGKVVPRRVTLEAMGRPLMEANTLVEFPLLADPTIFYLAGAPADPSETLRPLVDVKQAIDAAPQPPSFPPEVNAPEGTGLSLEITVDRRGTTREVEVIDASPLAPATADVPPYLRTAAKLIITEVQKQHYRPATIDTVPCEQTNGLIVFQGPFSGAMSGRH